MRASFCIALGLMLAGCAVNTAPPGFLVRPWVAQSQAYGGWVELRLANKTSVNGELIAVTADSVWVLGVSPVVLPVATITQGKLTITDAEVGNVTGMTALGVLSTISNGLVLILTAPVWIIVGTAAGSAQSYTPQRHVPPFTWAELNAFARFPQGMPPGVSLASLRLPPKPRR